MVKLIDQPRYVCALGAMQTVNAIERAVPVLHSGPGCGAKLSRALTNSNDGQGSGYISYHIYPSSNLSEREVVFGGSERLRETIVNSLKVIDADLFIVLTGCTSEIIGDDVGEVVRGFAAAGKPVLYAETAGFKGSNLLGHELVINAIIDQYLQPAPVQEKLVNLWATVPAHDPFWYGNLKQLEYLLSEIGLVPNTIFGPGRGVKAIDKVPQASFNLLVSPWVGLGNMEKLEKKLGTPYLQYPVLPIGPSETSLFLRTVGEYAGIDPAVVEEVIRRHEDEYYYYIEKAADTFLETRSIGRRFVTVADSFYALAVSRFLVNDMGLFPEKQFVMDGIPKKYEKRVRRLFTEYEQGISAEVEFTSDGEGVHEQIRATNYFGRPLIIGTIWEKVLAKELNGHYLGVSMPAGQRLILDRSYAGYQGALRLLEDIYSVVLETAI
ncbi:nitrogenase component 1 [Paenibacillus sp. S150]|uniref:nitrogenase component 1 n=1 Tax=Paenibacillus sp. S150 TaxID=2749826 RepID=UPI001C565A2D|nr:nitrogenase component 1 [Paenibacillus sp. S150]MBW4079784.1 hydrogenase [Paenibacillus sp. S150]